MKYQDALKKTNEAHICPFCEERDDYMFEIGQHFKVTTPRAPYVEDHILIIPKKHVIFLQELLHEELEELFQLIETWTHKLHGYHKDVTLLCKDGLVGGKSGKSVNHLHFHLVPDCGVIATNDAEAQSELDNREFFDDKTFDKIIADMKNKFLV